MDIYLKNNCCGFALKVDLTFERKPRGHLAYRSLRDNIFEIFTLSECYHTIIYIKRKMTYFTFLYIRNLYKLNLQKKVMVRLRKVMVT